uniref:Tyrosine-protein kinase ephrin type A/B receptor-like domain-containing protein n=1 Tax=Clytia hemisphaerica TaxID=252671 RepID=A0A7M5XIK9_9CNID
MQHLQGLTNVCNVIECPPGYYTTENGTAHCTICPEGNKCPIPHNLPIPCSEGEYQPEEGKDFCLPVPSGLVVTDGKTPKECQAGEYSNGTACVECPKGFYCPSSTTTPIVCKAGTYANALSSTSCQLCPSGYSCLNAADAPVACTAGSYSVAGQIKCTTCPTGQFSYNTASSCSPCPGGSYCTNGTAPIVPPLPCAFGFYSVVGQGQCKECPQHTYTPGFGAQFCTPCPVGSTCDDPTAIPIPCSDGTYWSNADETPKCIACPAGYSCEDAKVPPVPCKKGFYSTGGNSTCLPCPEGYSCLDSTQPVSCKIGEYSLSGVEYCTPCPPGFSCPTPNQAAGPCPAGTYSLKGEGTCNNCSAGFMCPSTSHAPIQCRVGQTANGLQNQVNCTNCLAGFACPTAASPMEECSAGYYSFSGATKCTYCPAGYQCPTRNSRPTICTQGTFSVGGQTTCHQCSAGFSCESIYSNSSKPCPGGTYAAAGSYKCTPCPQGSSCPDPTVSNAVSCDHGSFAVGTQTTCTVCPPGWECPKTDASENKQCQFGYYSKGNATSCTLCPAGFECRRTDISEPVACKPGTFSTGGQVKCTRCPSGSSCPDLDKATITPCPSGSYSLSGEATCTECPPGYACPSLFEPLILACPRGTYSVGAKSECTPCPAGEECKNNTQVGVACSDGYYSLEGSYSCTPCPAGYYCPVKNDRPRICEAGKYNDPMRTTCLDCNAGYVCVEGSTKATPEIGLCPLGSYCEDKINAIKCPSGTYGQKTGGISESDACKACPEGYYCEAGTPGFPKHSVRCPPGHFCLEGTKTASQHPCPNGFFNTEIGAVRQDQCKECLPGYYCSGGDPTGDSLCPTGHYCPQKTESSTQYPCSAGYYTEEKGATTATDCKVCPAGYYCLEGSDSPTACPPGTYNPVPMQGAASNCRQCEAGFACPLSASTQPTEQCSAGYYCPEGSSSPSDPLNACPAGTYTDYHNLTADSQCDGCPAGQACSAGTGGNQKPPQPCAAGYYCLPRTRHPKQHPCPAGSYSNLTNLHKWTDCTECPKGQYCLEGAAAPSGICPTGHYCPPGTKYATEHPCAAGTYSNRTANVRWEVCEDCTEGNYCPQGSSVPTACPKGRYRKDLNGKALGDCSPCPAGYYCPIDGTFQPLECGTGNFSSSNAWQCSICNAGYYCMSNTTTYVEMSTKLICPAGMHCPAGSDRQPWAANNPCEKGQYCVQGNEHAYPQKCPNGTYYPFTNGKHVRDCLPCREGYYCSPEGQTDLTDKCPPGYFCPEGTGYAFAHPCPVGYYRNSSAAISGADCSVCLSGMYCDIEGLPYPKDCPAGHFCPVGTVTPQPCPSGYYSNVTNVPRSVEFFPCPAGKYCAGTGNLEPTEDCDAGFYCKQAASTSAPPGGLTGGLCPAGGYCGRGAKKVEVCPSGYYNPNEGAKSPSDCIECPSGFYCAGSMKAEPTGPCNEGYFCNGTAKRPDQYPALAGSYAPKQSPAAIPCPRGTFQTQARFGKCDDCTEGAYCDESGLSKAKNCPLGAYCPVKTIIPIDCPEGTFNPEPSGKTLGDCQNCTAGEYCKGVGLNATSGKCFAGFYCLLGSPMPNPPDGSVFGGECQEGYYCPEGSVKATTEACLKATYNPIKGGTNSSACLPCPGGKACTGKGLAEPDAVCSPGYYCISGALRVDPTDGGTGHRCPIGNYCPGNTSTYIPCEPGTYSNVTTLSKCHECPERYYCNNRITPVRCPPGYYCSAGSGYEHIKPCPLGTWDENGGLAEESECTECPPTKYCGKLATTDFTSSNSSGLCAAGFYCKSGITTRTPYPPLTRGVGGVCPQGNYCLEGTDDPDKCPAGKYSSQTGLEREDQCTACEFGEYCETAGLNATSGKCDPGFYCYRGANSPNNPTDDGTSGPCPIGHYCPLGTSHPRGCPAGTYMPVTGQSECFPCMEGYYCPANSTDYKPYPCPAGHFDSIQKTPAPVVPSVIKHTDKNIAIVSLACPVSIVRIRVWRNRLVRVHLVFIACVDRRVECHWNMIISHLEIVCVQPIPLVVNVNPVSTVQKAPTNLRPVMADIIVQGRETTTRPPLVNLVSTVPVVRLFRIRGTGYTEMCVRKGNIVRRKRKYRQIVLQEDILMLRVTWS